MKQTTTRANDHIVGAFRMIESTTTAKTKKWEKQTRLKMTEHQKQKPITTKTNKQTKKQTKDNSEKSTNIRSEVQAILLLGLFSWFKPRG